MLLRQITKADGGPNTNPALVTLALSAMSAQAPLLDYAQFYPMVGNSDSINGVALATGVGENRAVGSDYTPNTLSPSAVAGSLIILGDKAQTDIAYERRGSAALGSERARQLESASKSIARHFMDQFINGTGLTVYMNGLKAQVTNTTSLGTDGLEVALGNSDANKTKQQQFIEGLDEMLATVNGGADVIVMDALTRARLQAVGREYVTVSTVTDAFGRQQILQTYQGIPIISAGYAKDNTTKILPFTETSGSNTDCGSVYGIKFGEKENCTLMTNSGLVVKDMGLSGTFYLTLVEMDAQTILVDSKSVGRLTGVRL